MRSGSGRSKSEEREREEERERGGGPGRRPTHGHPKLGRGERTTRMCGRAILVAAPIFRVGDSWVGPMDVLGDFHPAGVRVL